MNPNALQPGSRARAGNALFTAIVVMALAATVVATSMESSVTSQRAVVASTHGSEALAALDIVLARRQRVILDMAANAQPETYAVGVDNYGRDLATPASPVNYGVDFVGGCEVRWKVEPVYAQTHDPATATVDKVIENPTPDGATGAPANAVDNPASFFLYRVSAESRYNTLVHHDAEDSANDNVSVNATGKDVLARAQGVRYVTTTNDSVLKYLLYWAQSGPKGDLELSHGPATNLVGHIYSGGSIYFGSGTVCNDWLALRPSNGATTVGPMIAASNWVSGIPYAIGAIVKVGNLRYQAKDVHISSAANQPGSSGGTWKAYWEDVTACRVEGMDGVYRLSKQTLFSAFNSFPMASSPPSGFSLGSYILNTSAFPGERLGNTGSPSYQMPDPAYPSDVYNATYQGRVINPARARNPLATVPLSGSDTQRVINVAGDTGLTAVPLRGVDESASLVGNDSRDTARSLDSSSGYVWATDSLEATAPGFNRQVRSRSNGLAERPLNSRFIGRPEEPQKLVYYDLDGDPTTDEHEYAMPEFLSASGTTTDLTQRLQTASMISNGIESIESPGTYLQAALGNNLYLARRTDYKGWKVVDSTGNLANAEPSSGMGLVIRERPRPETTYFTPSILPSPSDLLYMPFAYGHVRASVWPMTACDVAAEMTDSTGTTTSTWTNGFATTTIAGLTTTSATQRYNTGGSVAFRAGTFQGPNSSTSQSPNFTVGINDTASAYQRFDYTTRDSWRFIALGRPKVTTTNGLNMTIWNDRPGTTWLAPFGGRPVYSTVVSGLSVNWTGVPTGSTGVGSDYFSVRWRGFIKPQYTDNYTFYANRSAGDCGIRVWVDDVMVIDSWGNSSSEVASQARPLAAEQYYPIVVEAYDTTGNFGPRIDWACSSLVRETLPANRVFTQTMPDGFDWNSFTAVETKLDSVSVATGKAGLMLRASNGISQVMDGREPYVTLGYSPSRGIFAQIRGERSGTSSGTQPGYFIGNGDTDNDANGTFETPLADPNGEIVTLPNVATLQRSATLTPVVTSMTYAPALGQTQMYTVYSPGKNAPGAAPAGATSPAGAWPANSGTSPLSTQADWIGSYNGTYTVWTPPTASPLGRTPDKPFSVAEGDVDRVWRSCAPLRVQRWPQGRSQARLDANFRFYLAGTNSTYVTSQLFRWIPGDAWSATSWPAYNSAVDDIDSNSSVKRLFLFSDRVGNRTPSGTFSSTNNLFALGANANSWNGGNSDIDTAGVDRGAVLYKTLGGGTTDSGWIYWFLDANADGRPDGTVTTWDKSTTATDLKTVYYVNNGTVDTRPKVFSGSTLVRVLTQAETLSLMDATYGGTHVAVTTLPTYPTLDTPAPAYAAGSPAVSDPAVAAAGMGYTRLAAAITNVATTLTVNSGINNGTRGYTIGDVLTLSSTAGIEYVTVTGFTDPGTVTVTRGVRGTLGLAHPINTLVSQMSIPVSSLGLAVAAGDTTWQVRSLGPILIGDVLQIDGEQVRVTGTTARVGATPASITVLRAQNGTTATTHVLESAISSPLPALGTLSIAHTNVITTLTMGSTAKMAAGDIVQVGGELMKVVSVLSPTQATVNRAYANTVATPQAANTTVFRTLGKTFAVSRSRTVTFDRNSWISAGSAPSPTWRALGTTQADTIDWGYTRANDNGWYWSGVPLYGTWKSFWSAVSPVPIVGGIPPRAYVASPGTVPLTGPAPVVDVPSVNPDNALPGLSVAGASPVTGASGRYQDDQPVTWVTGTVYQANDVVWLNNLMYKALSNHTATAATQPGVGASWSTAWQQTSLWLRVEKIPTTTKVRLLYALSATRPASNGEWRPLMTIPQVVNPPGAGRVTAAAADARELQVDLAPWFKAGRATVNTAMTAVQTTVTLTTPTTGSFAIGDVIQIEDEQLLITGGAAPTWTVTRNWSQTLATVPTHVAGVEVVQARWRGNDLLVGLCSQSGNSATLMDVAASNMRIETTSANPLLATIDATDWESSGATGTAPNDTTRYLCSQYQVFWGPYDITEDFFYSGQDGSKPRCANEDWIYNTRFFWSQSRWWDDRTTEKDPAYLFPDNASVLSMRELLAKTTILSLDMRAIQDYIMNTSLTTALSDRVVGAGPSGQTPLSGNYTLRDRVNVDGLLIHASRYNRYPWNPNIKGFNPWMPGYPLGNTTNVGGCATLPNSANGGLYTNAELAMLPNVSPAFTRRTEFENRLGGVVPSNSNNLTSAYFPDLMPYALGSGTTAGQLWKTPPIKPQDFHHAVRITNAADINWSYGTSNDYQSGGMSIFTPNQLYIQGDVNTTAHAVSFGGIPANKANKLGIFCDTAIMLSNSWNDLNFRNPGLTMNTTTQLVTGPFPSTLAMNQGGGNILPTASNTQYQFALLTHTQPTTRASVRMGEASSFISTMQYLEDWSGRTMTLVGSIVAMDSRRYTRSYLLDAQKQNGLSPFGWMTAGGNPASTTAWVTEYSTTTTTPRVDSVWPFANTAGTTQLNNGVSIAVNNRWLGAIQGVYGAPTRNLFYNPDFYYKPGQPPLMPFGTKATGMGGWSKIIQ